MVDSSGSAGLGEVLLGVGSGGCRSRSVCLERVERERVRVLLFFSCLVYFFSLFRVQGKERKGGVHLSD